MYDAKLPWGGAVTAPTGPGLAPSRTMSPDGLRRARLGARTTARRPADATGRATDPARLPAADDAAMPAAPARRPPRAGPRVLLAGLALAVGTTGCAGATSRADTDPPRPRPPVTNDAGPPGGPVEAEGPTATGPPQTGLRPRATAPRGAVASRTLTVIAREEAGGARFDAPDQVVAGPVPVDFVNEGSSPHQLLIVRPKPTADPEQVAEALTGPVPAAALGFTDLVGGAGTLEKGARQEVVLDLDPGHYFLVSLAVGADGVSQARQGLVRPIEAVASRDPAPPDSARDATSTLRLQNGTVSAPRTLAGPTWFEVHNDEPIPVGLAVLQLQPGKDEKDAAAWLPEALSTVPAPEPPFRWIGGVGPLPPGATARLHVDQRSGRYLLAPVVPGVTGLFLPSTDGGHPHLIETP